MMIAPSDPKILLLAEDDEADYKLFEMAFNEVMPETKVERVKDGFEVVNHLNRSNKKPDLVVLDLNLPGMSGIEALEKIRTLPDTEQIPIVILTTSGSPRDFEECRSLGALEVYTKPYSLEELAAIANKLCVNYLGRSLAGSSE